MNVSLAGEIPYIFNFIDFYQCIFIVEDSGSGFTKEALLHGTEQFFMDDTSRNGEAHYGIGLFFAKTVAEKYGGGIKLSSSENTGGARVEIFFLSSQETS